MPVFSWTSFELGHAGTLIADDIYYSSPDGKECLVLVCQLSAIMSRCSKDLYLKRQKTLREIWETASLIDNDLRIFGASAGIGTIASYRTSTPETLQSIQGFHLNRRRYSSAHGPLATERDPCSLLSYGRINLSPIPDGLGSNRIHIGMERTL